MNSDIVSMTLSAIVALAIVASPVACSMDESRTLQTLIKDGVDPIAARCSISPGGSNRDMCLVFAGSHKK